MYFGGREVLGDRLSVGTYSFMVFIVQDLLWPFSALSEIMDEYQRAMASVRRVMSLLNTEIAIVSGVQRLSPPEIRGEVKFDNITFAYRASHLVLKMSFYFTIR